MNLTNSSFVCALVMLHKYNLARLTVNLAPPPPPSSPAAAAPCSRSAPPPAPPAPQLTGATLLLLQIGARPLLQATPPPPARDRRRPPCSQVPLLLSRLLAALPLQIGPRSQQRRPCSPAPPAHRTACPRPRRRRLLLQTVPPRRRRCPPCSRAALSLRCRLPTNAAADSDRCPPLAAAPIGVDPAGAAWSDRRRRRLLRSPTVLIGIDPAAACCDRCRPLLAPPPFGFLSTPGSHGASGCFITGLQGPTILLDGTNYVTWSAGFCRFLEIHGRLSFLTENSASLEDPRFATWVTQDQAVTAWLLKMAIPVIAEPMQLISPSKAIWDEWARMYGYRSNIGRTVEIVEGMFRALQGTRTLQDFYATLRSLLNQHKIYQPYTADLTVQRRYREEIVVGLFLAGINPTLGSQICGHILSSATLPTLGKAFSTALRKFGKPGQVANSSTTDCSSASDVLTISREEYDRLLAIRAPTDTSSTTGSHTSHIASASTSGTALLASPSGSWIIDSGASAHMSSTPSLLSRISSLPHPETVTIADGRLGKHFRSTDSRLDSISSTKPFDLVHCDVWGPSRVSSISNFRYYIVFVDDFSRLSWVYLLHDRTDVLSSVRQFLQEISTQYSSTPKILRTDNALEFVQSALPDLCSSLGIIHQTTCPYTSQQNGVAERKHRHLLDMTRTLLIEMGVPHYLWSDALLTSAYLFNRLPSSPLGGEVPLPRLHPDRELFVLPPRKGTRSCTLHPISHYVNYGRLHPTYRAFSLSLTSELIPRSHLEALSIPHWKEAMDQEYAALTERRTWILVPRPRNTNIVTCRWIFTVKYKPDGTGDRYKARLVARGFTQTYGIDYKETFSPVLDVSNAFLYGELTEQVLMEQPPGYSTPSSTGRVCHLQCALYGLKQSPRAWFAKFSKLVLALGLTPCTVDPKVFRRHGPTGTVILAVYVDDILLTGSDHAGIAQVKAYLHQHLTIRDLGTPKYFLGIEFAHQSGKLILNQGKYVLDMLEEAGLLGCKPRSSPIDSKPCFWDSTSLLLNDVEPY
ncbi:uncharacterized protein LOC144716399 [Wolffia australiana]